MLRVGQWADFVSQAKPRQKDESGNPGVAHRGDIPIFPSFPVFFVPQFDSLRVLDSQTIFRLKGTINTGYAWLGPATS